MAAPPPPPSYAPIVVPPSTLGADFAKTRGDASLPEGKVTFLVGDDEGVVVIPRYLADEVALAAARQEHKEDFILSKIQGGAPLSGTYPADESTDAEYEAYCRDNPLPGE